MIISPLDYITTAEQCCYNVFKDDATEKIINSSIISNFSVLWCNKKIEKNIVIKVTDENINLISEKTSYILYSISFENVITNYSPNILHFFSPKIQIVCKGKDSKSTSKCIERHVLFDALKPSIKNEIRVFII